MYIHNNCKFDKNCMIITRSFLSVTHIHTHTHTHTHREACMHTQDDHILLIRYCSQSDKYILPVTLGTCPEFGISSWGGTQKDGDIRTIETGNHRKWYLIYHNLSLCSVTCIRYICLLNAPNNSLLASVQRAFYQMIFTHEWYLQPKHIYFWQY